MILYDYIVWCDLRTSVCYFPEIIQRHLAVMWCSTWLSNSEFHHFTNYHYFWSQWARIYNKVSPSRLNFIYGIQCNWDIWSCVVWKILASNFLKEHWIPIFLKARKGAWSINCDLLQVYTARRPAEWVGLFDRSVLKWILLRTWNES